MNTPRGPPSRLPPLPGHYLDLCDGLAPKFTSPAAPNPASVGRLYQLFRASTTTRTTHNITHGAGTSPEPAPASSTSRSRRLAAAPARPLLTARLPASTHRLPAPTHTRAPRLAAIREEKVRADFRAAHPRRRVQRPDRASGPYAGRHTVSWGRVLRRGAALRRACVGDRAISRPRARFGGVRAPSAGPEMGWGANGARTRRVRCMGVSGGLGEVPTAYVAGRDDADGWERANAAGGRIRPPARRRRIRRAPRGAARCPSAYGPVCDDAARREPAKWRERAPREAYGAGATPFGTSSMVGGAGGSCARGTRRRRAVRSMDAVVSTLLYVPRVPPRNTRSPRLPIAPCARPQNPRHGPFLVPQTGY
ncbi:hypothetical protein VTO73DRAFT_6704 [Trametes versicolor]